MTEKEFFIKMIERTVPAHADKRNYMDITDYSHGCTHIVLYGANEEELIFIFDNDDEKLLEFC